MSSSAVSSVSAALAGTPRTGAQEPLASRTHEAVFGEANKAGRTAAWINSLRSLSDSPSRTAHSAWTIGILEIVDVMPLEMNGAMAPRNHFSLPNSQ